MSITRFSSQLQSLFGLYPRVNSTGAGPSVEYRYFGAAPSRDYAYLSADGTPGVVGYLSGNQYNQAFCFYQSRGAAPTTASAFSLVAVDSANILGITAGSFLENSQLGIQTRYNRDIIGATNLLRNYTNQVSKSSDIINRSSLKARQIRA